MNVYIESLLNGLMVYWDEEKDAARYYVHLLIGEKHKYIKSIKGRETAQYTEETFREIAVVETERNIKYHAFLNLGQIEEVDHREFYWDVYSAPDVKRKYYVYVEAEDKNGSIISISEKTHGKVYVMLSGNFCYK